MPSGSLVTHFHHIISLFFRRWKGWLLIEMNSWSNTYSMLTGCSDWVLISLMCYSVFFLFLSLQSWVSSSFCPPVTLLFFTRQSCFLHMSSHVLLLNRAFLAPLLRVCNMSCVIGLVLEGARLVKCIINSRNEDSRQRSLHFLVKLGKMFEKIQNN